MWGDLDFTRFWVIMTCIHVTAANVLTRAGTKIFFAQILFFGVAFHPKPIFGIKVFSIQVRLTRSLRLFCRNFRTFQKEIEIFAQIQIAIAPSVLVLEQI